MKFSGAKILLISSIIFGAPFANASLYRINLTYGGDSTGESGTLTGTFVIDTTQANYTSNTNNTTLATSFALPAWITQASLTISGAEANNGTYTTFDRIAWTIAEGSTFDINQNFANQMVRFGFSDQNSNAVFALPLTGTPRKQRASNSEFPLLSSTTSAAPGPLPILGLGTLFYYFRKFKRNPKNL